MAYTLAGIRNRVINDKLDDPAYDTAIVDRFINDAQRAIFNTYELPFMETVFSGTLPGGGYIYSFPVEYQLLQSIKLTSPTAQKRDITDLYIPFRRFNELYPTPGNLTSGVPQNWTLYGGKIYFSRPTDINYILEIYYLKKPTLLDDDGDIPEIPSEFEELLVLGAYYRVLERNEDFDLASFYKNGDYTDELDKLSQRLGKRQIGTPQPMPQPLRNSGRARSSGRH